MFVKGFIYRLPDIETDNVDLLTRTFYTTVVVSDWCITNRAHRWWVSIQGIVGIIGGVGGGELFPQRSIVVAVGC